MNPFQAIMGGSAPMRMPAGQNTQPMAGGPAGMLQNVFQQMQQLAGTFQNPQAMIQKVFPNAPEEVRNDPDQLLAWMQQSGMVTPQIIQMARQMYGR